MSEISSNRSEINNNPGHFQKSISDEMNAVKNRLASFIGDSHRPSEGAYYEAILKTVLQRHLPKTVEIGTGFIVKFENGKCKPSTQIDLIIYDVTYPVVFKQDDFIITTSDAVQGIVEVKKKLQSGKIKDVLKKCSENGIFLKPDAFNGIFSFENDVDINSPALESHLKESKGIVNHICFGDKYFVKYWGELQKKYSRYDIPGYSYAYFISNLLEIATPHNLEGRYGIMYPIPGGKELKKIDPDINIE